MKRFLVASLLTLTLLFTAGFQVTCGSGNRQQAARTAEEQFAINTSRLAEHTNQAMRLTDELVTSKLISPATGTVIVDKLLNVNHVNKLLVQTASQFIVIENGVRVLRFTEDSRSDLEKLARALNVATKGVVNHPDWVKVDPKARDELNRFLDAMTTISLRIVNLIQQARKITVGNPAFIELSYGTNDFDCEFGAARVGALGLAYKG